jgi:hypothetical protein
MQNITHQLGGANYSIFPKLSWIAPIFPSDDVNN